MAKCFFIIKMTKSIVRIDTQDSLKTKRRAHKGRNWQREKNSFHSWALIENKLMPLMGNKISNMESKIWNRMDEIACNMHRWAKLGENAQDVCRLGRTCNERCLFRGPLGMVARMPYWKRAHNLFINLDGFVWSPRAYKLSCIFQRDYRWWIYTKWILMRIGQGNLLATTQATTSTECPQIDGTAAIW